MAAIVLGASAGPILVILPTARSQRAVFFRRRCSLSFIVSLDPQPAVSQSVQVHT